MTLSPSSNAWCPTVFWCRSSTRHLRLQFRPIQAEVRANARIVLHTDIIVGAELVNRGSESARGRRQHPFFAVCFDPFEREAGLPRSAWSRAGQLCRQVGRLVVSAVGSH